MLTLYHTPLSINSRRVWIALLEKGLTFTTVEMDLDGDQLTPEFLNLNPFHHIPVLVDDGFTVIESFAILDYLEAKFPAVPLLPTDPEAIARTRMIQLVSVNELAPALMPLFKQMMGLATPEPAAIAQAKQQVERVLQFYTTQLAEVPFFGGDRPSLADVVAGTFTPRFEALGLSLSAYPALQAWTARLLERPAWQATEPTPETLAALRDRLQARLAAQE